MLTTLGNNVTELGQPLSGIQGVDYDATTWVLPSNDVNGILIPNNVIIPSLFNDLQPVISQNMYPSGKNVSVLDQSYLVPLSADTSVIVDSYWNKTGTTLTPKDGGTSILVESVLLKTNSTVIGVDSNGNIIFKDAYYTSFTALKDLIGSNYIAGTGIAVNTVGNDKVISNILPDQTVTLTSGNLERFEITGTYPDFTLTPIGGSDLTAGDNITIVDSVVNSTDITIIDPDIDGVIVGIEVDPTDSHAITLTRSILSNDYTLLLGINTNTPNTVSSGSTIKFVQGTGITLTQTGTEITINASSGIYVPNANFTATTHTVGALPAGTANTSISNISLNDIINKLLYKDILATFSVPTLSTTVALSSVITNSGTWLEKGITKTVDIVSNFATSNYSNSVNNLGVTNTPQAFAIVDTAVAYTKNSVAFTTGTSVVFDNTIVFGSTMTYVANPNCNQKDSTGAIINASSFTGYPSNRLLSNNITYNVTNPIYYGTITSTNSSVWVSGFNDSATWTKIKATTKYIGAKPTTLDLVFSPYSGAVLSTNWIVIATPYQLKDVINKATGYSEYSNYTEISNAKYTRLDSVVESVYVYYAPNKFTTTAGTADINLTLKF